MDKVKLNLVGITYNQIESGVYAVILQQEGGTRRIPIIIGFPEAQSIECKLQEVVTPRPLTHDMMANVMSTFGVTLNEVNIYKLPNGVFAAELVMTNGNETHVIDSRSSDAIALAIRTGTPIYTTAAVLDEAGFEPGESGKRRTTGPEPTRRAEKEEQPKAEPITEFSLKSIQQLNDDMQKAAESENYEEAARIKAEIDRRMKGEPGKEDL